jgi:hypothetical protein
MAAQQARDARPAVPLSAPATIDGVAIGTEPAKAAGAQAETERSTVTHRLASRRDDPAPVTPENWQRLSDEQETRRRARGFFTIEEAAKALGEQEGMHDGARKSLLKRMMEAARDGTLTVRDPHTDLPFRPAEVHGYYELVTPADVNAWLAGCGVEYRWNAPAGEPEPAPNEARAAGEPTLGAEGSAQRRARLARRRDELKAQGVRDYTKRIAAEEGIGEVRVRQLLRASKPSARTPSAADPFGLTRKPIGQRRKR